MFYVFFVDASVVWCFLFRVFVCVGLVPCVPWFQLFIIVLGFNHCVTFGFFFIIL